MARNNLFRLAVAIVLVTPAAPSQIITTIAGTNFTFPPGAIPAANAPLGAVTGTAVDAAGNVFVVDSGNNLVLRISPNGTLSVAAGNGISGFSGDAGLAADASLAFPTAVAVDSAGNLYIADTSNQRIRKVSGGTITTIAGNGIFGFSGDGGPATSASLGTPMGVAVDAAGNLYIADTGNARIRKVSGGTITTVAGNGVLGFSGDGGPATSASLSEPNGVAVDSAANLYIADPVGQRVRQVSNGTISTVAGNGDGGFGGDGGSATSASLNSPTGVAVDAAGNIYIADDDNYRIRKVSGGTITTVAGNGSPGFSGDGGPATRASFAGPFGVAVDSAGNLYIADSPNSRVRKVSGGTITTLAGNGTYKFSGDGGPAVSASLNLPNAVTRDLAGNLYIGDFLNNRVRRISNGIITTVAGIGPSCSVSAALVCGGFSGDGGPATSASLSQPVGVAVDPAGNLYIADSQDNRVREVSNGTITTIAGNGIEGFSGDGGPATSAALYDPTSVALDSAGNLYIADPGNNRVRKLSGGFITTVAGNGIHGFSGDGGPATSAALNFPSGVAVDAAGDLYIADNGNHRIRKVSGGTITTVAGNGNPGFSGDGGTATAASLHSPTQVAVDAAGNVYVADLANNRIRKVSGGIIATIAGNGTPGFSGDGGPATSASLDLPQGVAVDSAGNVYVVDTANNRVREIPASAPSFQATPLSLSFSAIAGGNLPDAQSINLSSSVAGLAFTASASANWLSVTPSAGAVPSVLQVSVNPAALSPASYQGTITIVSPNAVPSAARFPA
jgi:sugar lactone lactonase YvrE